MPPKKPRRSKSLEDGLDDADLMVIGSPSQVKYLLKGVIQLINLHAYSKRIEVDLGVLATRTNNRNQKIILVC